jgi:hypothetical protein
MLYRKNADQISYSDPQQLLSLGFIFSHKHQMDPYSKWAYGLNGSGFESQQKQFIFFSSPKRPYWFWRPPSI